MNKLIPPEPLSSYLLKITLQLRRTIYNILMGVEPYSKKRLEEILEDVDQLIEKIKTINEKEEN